MLANFSGVESTGLPPSPPARAPEWSITQSSFSYGTELSFRKTVLNLYLRS